MKNHNSRVSAAAPKTGTKQYHIACETGDVARYVLLPGDPARVDVIAAGWDSAKDVADHREYRTKTGRISGISISCTSSGIGPPPLSIALEELSAIGADTFIRVGTTGGIQPGQELGDLVISTGGVRLDGASHDYVMPEYPAVADYEVVMALVQAAEELGVRYHVGFTASTDTFYAGQGRPGYTGVVPSHKRALLEDLQHAHVQNFEMEAACLFTLSSLFQKRAGAICVIIANRVTDEFEVTEEMQAKAGRVASRAVVILESWDKKKQAAGKKYLYPALLK